MQSKTAVLSTLTEQTVDSADEHFKHLSPNFCHQCRSRLLPLPEPSRLATIAELMGLVLLFSFPSAGSIDPACNQPCFRSPLLSLTQSHISPGHTPLGPLALFISCPSLHGATNLSLSFFCHLSLCTLSRSA